MLNIIALPVVLLSWVESTYVAYRGLRGHHYPSAAVDAIRMGIGLTTVIACAVGATLLLAAWRFYARHPAAWKYQAGAAALAILVNVTGIMRVKPPERFAPSETDMQHTAGGDKLEADILKSLQGKDVPPNGGRSTQ